MADITDQARVGSDEVFWPTINNRIIAPFSPVLKSIGVHSKHSIKVYPTRPIGVNDNEITFDMPSVGSAWVDLKNADVYIKGSLKLADGAKMTGTEEAMLVRNTYCALFESCTLHVGASFTEIVT